MMAMLFVVDVSAVAVVIAFVVVGRGDVVGDFIVIVGRGVCLIVQPSYFAVYLRSVIILGACHIVEGSAPSSLRGYSTTTSIWHSVIKKHFFNFEGIEP